MIFFFLNGCSSGCLSAMRMFQLERKRKKREKAKALASGSTAVEESNSFPLFSFMTRGTDHGSVQYEASRMKERV